jgi:carboxypeptidase C (cathepsin A)
MVRHVLIALAAFWLATPAFAAGGDTGPDAGMQAQLTVSAKVAPQAGGEKSDPECDAHAAEAAAGGRADRARCRKLTDADIVTAPIAEQRQATRHQATIGGKPLAYTATAGTLTLRDDEGKPTASMFYVAYTTGDARRPVTFLYNGGPGSSTVWLHMGSLGPVRVLTDSPSPTHNAPYDLANNDSSLLDKTDLVFLDAVGAGFSRPLGDTQLTAFLGHRPGHRRLRPRHRTLADHQQPLERAQVPVRRELRHHPLSRTLLPPAA